MLWESEPGPYSHIGRVKAHKQFLLSGSRAGRGGARRGAGEEGSGERREERGAREESEEREWDEGRGERAEEGVEWSGEKRPAMCQVTHTHHLTLCPKPLPQV